MKGELHPSKTRSKDGLWHLVIPTFFLSGGRPVRKRTPNLPNFTSSALYYEYDGLGLGYGCLACSRRETNSNWYLTLMRSLCAC